MLAENGKGKNRSRLASFFILTKSPKIEEKRRKRRRRKTATHWLKKMCFHFDLLLCVSLRQSLRSDKILFVFEQELLQKQKERALTRQHVCLVLGMLIKSQGRGFQVRSQENIPLNAHIFAVWHRAWKPITQTVVAIWFVFQERLSSWDIIRDECWVMWTKDSSHLTSKAPPLPGPCPKKRSFSREGTVTCQDQRTDFRQWHAALRRPGDGNGNCFCVLLKD